MRDLVSADLVSPRADNEPGDTAALPACPAGFYHLRERWPEHTLADVVSLGFNPVWTFTLMVVTIKPTHLLFRCFLKQAKSHEQTSRSIICVCLAYKV